MFEELKPHLVELRKRLIICAFVLVLFFAICFGFWEEILQFMTAPLKDALPKQGNAIITTHVAEAFLTYMKVAFFAGFIFSMPVIFWQAWLFVAPGLYDNEKRYVMPFVFSATVMFLIGASFCYYIVIPMAYHFLLNFGSSLFVAMPKISEYVGFFAKFIVAFGLSFELPVVTFFLAKIGLVTDRTLSDSFAYAVVAIFVFAAIMTPPDILSQFLLAIPLVILYGISILIARAINPAAKE